MSRPEYEAISISEGDPSEPLLDKPCPAPPRTRSRLRWPWVLWPLGVSLVLAAAGTTFYTKADLYTDIKSLAKLPVKPKKPVLIRIGELTNEGIGSAPQHFKSSILLAELLDRHLVLSELRSEHNYSLSDIFNIHSANAEDHLEFAQPVCEITLHGMDWLWQAHGACNDDQKRQELKETLLRDNGHCGTIIHKVTTAEIIEDLNGCVHPWFQRNLRHSVCAAKWAPGEGSSDEPRGPVKIGVHFRYGDTANMREGYLARGVSPAEVNRAIDALKKCGVPLEATVYAQGLPGDFESEFTFVHTVVDSGDDLQDLCRLGQSEVIIAGGSSYAVMAYQLGRNRLSLITDRGMYKYSRTDSDKFTAVSLDDIDNSIDTVCTRLARPTAGSK